MPSVRPPHRAMRGVVAVAAGGILALGLAAAIGCDDGRPAPRPELTEAPPDEGLRVLFIGNSLTASNDLPHLVRALAAAAGEKPPVVETFSPGGFSLEDHWNQGAARRALAKGGWDVVVLQQGPSALEESRELLIRDARRFAAEIRRVGARPALYMVWPSSARFGDFDRVCESYRLAASEVDGLLFPAGEAWRAAWNRDPELALYSADGLHPTLAGSYLAALVIYQKLYDASPVGLPSRLTIAPGRVVDVGLSPAQVEHVQAAAAEANAESSED